MRTKSVLLPDPIDAAPRVENTLIGRKILILVENLPVPFDRRVWREARTLKEAGAQVSVICPTGPGHDREYEVIDGIHIYRHTLREAGSTAGYLREYGTALFHEMRLAMRVARRQGFDTIQACNPPDLLFLVALPFKLVGKRFIFDHHDINPELFEAKFGRRGVAWRLLCFFEWLTFKVADVVISTNQSYRRIAMTRGGKSGEDVFVVRSGPDLSRVQPVSPDPGLKNGRRFLIGYVGVMGEQEGIDLLLESARHLVHNKGREDIQFVLVGGGPALAEMRAYAERLGLADYVTFTGRAPDEMLFRVLSTADVCVNPDRVNPMNDKSTMNKILEYMAFSKPIVQFDVTEGRFSAQEASLYARANDPLDFAARIEVLLADETARTRMGAYGRRRVERELAWDYEAPKLIAAYQRCQ